MEVPLELQNRERQRQEPGFVQVNKMAALGIASWLLPQTGTAVNRPDLETWWHQSVLKIQ